MNELYWAKLAILMVISWAVGYACSGGICGVKDKATELIGTVKKFKEFSDREDSKKEEVADDGAAKK